MGELRSEPERTMSSSRVVKIARLFLVTPRRFALRTFSSRALTRQNPSPSRHHHRHLVDFSCKPNSSISILRLLNTSSSCTEDSDDGREYEPIHYEIGEEGEIVDEWEDEDETEPQLGDGGDGGGIVLQGVPWGQRTLSIAQEVLSQFGDEMEIFAFKTTAHGYIYLRLDKISQKYGCPSMEELQSYSEEYKKRLDEVGALGEIPDDLALEVSSPGGERLLKIPDDLNRFKDMPMRVCYMEDTERNSKEKVGFFMLESIDMESESCVWKLAKVKENRDPQSKGRPLSRKQKDWRLKVPYSMLIRVNLYFS